MLTFGSGGGSVPSAAYAYARCHLSDRLVRRSHLPVDTMRSIVPRLALEVDFVRRSARVDGLPVDLTAIEFDILAALAREPGVLVARSSLLELVWGPGFLGDDYLVDLHVANLRDKLAGDVERGDLVEAVGVAGYRLASTD
jgi:DNA-binding response OmpR family regulator